MHCDMPLNAARRKQGALAKNDEPTANNVM
jgi:hypothetical protein